MDQLEREIAEWRAFVEESPTVDGQEVEELETHLRDQISELTGVGLATDEAFLISVKRMGKLDELSREFAQEHSGRLWRQLVASDDEGAREADRSWVLAVLFGLGAAVAIQIARLAGVTCLRRRAASAATNHPAHGSAGHRFSGASQLSSP